MAVGRRAGLMALTRTPSAANSSAMDLVNDSTAALLAPYMAMPATPRCAADEARLSGP
jgi:hypothetical protein